MIRDCYRVRDVFKMKTFHTTTVAKDTCTTDRPLCQRTEFYLLLRDLEIKRNVNKLKTRKYSNKWTAERKYGKTKGAFAVLSWSPRSWLI